MRRVGLRLQPGLGRFEFFSTRVSHFAGSSTSFATDGPATSLIRPKASPKGCFEDVQQCTWADE